MNCDRRATGCENPPTLNIQPMKSLCLKYEYNRCLFIWMFLALQQRRLVEVSFCASMVKIISTRYSGGSVCTSVKTTLRPLHSRKHFETSVSKATPSLSRKNVMVSSIFIFILRICPCKIKQVSFKQT